MAESTPQFPRSSKLQTRACANPECGQSFQAYPSQPRKFCTQVCSWSAAGKQLRLKPKTCVQCGNNFQPTSAHQKWCQACAPTKRHRTALARYGMPAQHFEALLARQVGRCAICQRPMTKANRDHCHATGVWRELLCNHCNVGLHYLEDPEWLAAATVYLQRWAA